jgi:hypothetical protein
MADIEWQPLPTLWPSPAIWTDLGECMLLVFTQDGLPIMGSPSQSKLGGSSDDLKASLAERVGFEPTVRLHAQRFSRPPRSATLAPLRGARL